MAVASPMAVPSSSTSTGVSPAWLSARKRIAPLPGILRLQLEVQTFFLQQDSQLAGRRLQTEMIQATHGPTVYPMRATAKLLFARAATAMRPCARCHRGGTIRKLAGRTNTRRCKMQIGMIGLGRMGGNIVRRLLRSGHRCVVFDRQSEPVRQLAAEGAVAAADLKELVAQLEKPRAVWVMLPAGEITDRAVTELGALHGARRHHHRRRQFLLQGRHPAGGRFARARDPLRRRRHQRRCLGPGARLLHDDRRRQGDGRPPRSDLRRPGAGAERHRRRRPAARRATPVPSAATSIAARTAPVISSR